MPSAIRGSRTYHSTPSATLSGAVACVTTVDTHNLGVKAREYAQWGAPVYWVLDLPSQSVIVHERPVGDRYELVSRHTGADPITFSQAGRVVSAAELLRLPTS